MRGSFEWHKKTQTEVSDKLKIAEEHSLVCSGLCFDNSINIFSNRLRKGDIQAPVRF